MAVMMNLRNKPKKRNKSISIFIKILNWMKKFIQSNNREKLKQGIHIQQKNMVRFIKEHQTVKGLHLIRNYSAFMVVAASALLVSATNLASGKESSGFLFGYLGGASENYESPLANKMFSQTNKKEDLSMLQLAESKTAPEMVTVNEESDGFLLQGQALVAGTSPVRKDPEEDGGVKIYEVQSGDTVSSIAAANHITVNTILWSNELDNVDSIRPGDKLFILPVAGVTYTVQKNDTIDEIAKKYKANKEKIIAFNDLPANGELTSGETITIPDGQKEVITTSSQNMASSLLPNVAPRAYAPFSVSGKQLTSATGAGHKFPYGYCTWYVAQKRHIPWGGNAGTWLYHAKSMGYATGRAPRVGAIMVSSESWWGHVAIVESVSGNQFTISEMNAVGWAKKSRRTLNTGSFRALKGFIY